MASYTPNYNLKKPADADSYDIADANGNMDIIDGALDTLKGNLSYVIPVSYDGKTPRWISSGEYILVFGGSLSPGVYKATQGMSAGTTLTLSNVTISAYGNLANDLNRQVELVNNKINNNVWTDITGSSQKYTILQGTQTPSKYIKRGGLCFVNLAINCVTPATSSEIITSSLPTPNTQATINLPVPSDYTYGDTSLRLLWQSGHLYAIGGVAGHYYYVSFCYPCD